jgi:hypothetical protein
VPSADFWGVRKPEQLSKLSGICMTDTGISGTELQTSGTPSGALKLD